MQWCDFRTKKTGVVYIAAEGLGGLAARFEAWCITHNVIPDNFWIREYPVGLTVAGAAEKVAQEIATLGNIGLIILDTFAGNFGIGSENDAADMSAALVGLRGLSCGRMVINIHHTGHQEKQRSRGHSSLFAAIDVELLAKKESMDESETKQISLQHTKCRDFDRMMPLGFEIKPVSLPWVDEDLEPINSAVLMRLPEWQPEAVPKKLTKEDLKGKAAECLTVLKGMYAERSKSVPNPRVTLKEWNQAISPILTTKQHRSNIKTTLESSGFIRMEHNFVFVT